MRVVLENKKVCQYVLRKLLKKPDLIIIECKTEVQISKLFGKDLRLDVLATDETGKMFDLVYKVTTNLYREVKFKKRVQNGYGI